MQRILILVEGQTEERFVKDVLAPEMAGRDIAITPVLLTTKVVKDGTNFRGGVTSYAKIRNDLIKLLRDTNALVTTLIDYYGLPEDVPGMVSRPSPALPQDRARHVEEAIRVDLGSPQNFEPFLILHEFEAMLFVDCEITASVIPARERAGQLAAAAESLAPEEINENRETSPSKRMKKVFPEFRKTLHGPTAVKRIGLERIRAVCPHFDNWMTWVEGDV